MSNPMTLDEAGPLAEQDRARAVELASAATNGRVGTTLVSETAEVRVWHLTLAPGQRLPFHRHVLDYFWTVLSDGRGRSHYGDGTVREVAYRAGDTRHFSFAGGEDMVHDLENTGPEPLAFVTVEFKNGKNPPLALP